MGSPCTVKLSATKTRAKIASGGWSEVVTIPELRDRLALYRRLAKRKNGRYAAHHQPMVDAIESALAEVRG